MKFIITHFEPTLGQQDHDVDAPHVVAAIQKFEALVSGGAIVCVRRESYPMPEIEVPWPQPGRLALRGQIKDPFTMQDWKPVNMACYIAYCELTTLLNACSDELAAFMLGSILLTLLYQQRGRSGEMIEKAMASTVPHKEHEDVRADIIQILKHCYGDFASLIEVHEARCARAHGHSTRSSL